MKEEVEKILKETNKLVASETANMPPKRKDAAMYGRATRHISIAEKSAAEDYYKKSGRSFDVDEDTPAHIRIIGTFFVYAMIAGLVNLVLYLPVNFLARSWGEVNRHDAVYVTIIINTLISAVLVGLLSEITTKRKAFIAGMRAEADNHIIAKYHDAMDRVDKSYIAKGNLPDDFLKWRD